MGKIVNRAKMTVSGTPGAGTITLGSAVAGFRTFAAAGVQNGDVVSYVIEDGSGWEIGQGTYTSSGTTLARTTVQESSNSNAAISATSGAVVYITALAADISAGLKLLGVYTPSSVATLDITSVISSAYDDYLLVFENIVPSTNGTSLIFRVSTNGGSTFATTGYLDWGGASSINVMEPGVGFLTVSNTAAIGVSGVLWLFNINSTTKHRLANGDFTTNDGTANHQGQTSGGYATTGAAINALRVMFLSGNIASGTVKIYGLQKS